MVEVEVNGGRRTVEQAPQLSRVAHGEIPVLGARLVREIRKVRVSTLSLRFCRFPGLVRHNHFLRAEPWRGTLLGAEKSQDER